jgi:hypothetical protein
MIEYGGEQRKDNMKKWEKEGQKEEMKEKIDGSGEEQEDKRKKATETTVYVASISALFRKASPPLYTDFIIAMWKCAMLPTFRRHMLPPTSSSILENCWASPAQLFFYRKSHSKAR